MSIMIRDVFVAVRRRIKFNDGEARSVAAAIRRHGYVEDNM